MNGALTVHSSGSGIAMYEPPYNNDPGAQESWSQYLRQLRQALAGRWPPGAPADPARESGVAGGDYLAAGANVIVMRWKPSERNMLASMSWVLRWACASSELAAAAAWIFCWARM